MYHHQLANAPHGIDLAVHPVTVPMHCTLLNVLHLLPVTSAEVERAHSAFKLIKTKTRSTTGEDRLNALVLLYYHKKGYPLLAYGAVIDMYVRRHPEGWSS